MTRLFPTPRCPSFHIARVHVATDGGQNLVNLIAFRLVLSMCEGDAAVTMVISLKRQRDIKTVKECLADIDEFVHAAVIRRGVMLTRDNKGE